MSYKNLEIWQLARELVIDIQSMTLEKLPKFEMFEEGSQIRRSMKTVKSAIAEGYGRRNYVQDYQRYLIMAISSNDETIDHLETLFETKSLTDDALYRDLHARLDTLGRKLNMFIQAVEKRPRKSGGFTKRSTTQDLGPNSQHPEPRTQNLGTSNG
jgi:four helix bundle protein